MKLFWTTYEIARLCECSPVHAKLLLNRLDIAHHRDHPTVKRMVPKKEVARLLQIYGLWEFIPAVSRHLLGLEESLPSWIEQ